MAAAAKYQAVFDLEDRVDVGLRLARMETAARVRMLNDRWILLTDAQRIIRNAQRDLIPSANVVTAPGDLGFVHAFLNTWGLEGQRERFENPDG